ncbi:MAG: hypothetical protein U0610_05815 [bacterium]
MLVGCAALAASCHREPPAATPEAALGGLLAAAADRDEMHARRFLTSRTLELMGSIESTARAIHATNVPEHVLASFLENFARQAPALIGAEPSGNHATLAIRYRSGHAARPRLPEGRRRLEARSHEDLEPKPRRSSKARAAASRPRPW